MRQRTDWKARAMLTLIGILFIYHLIKVGMYFMGTDGHQSVEFLSAFKQDIPLTVILISQCLLRFVIVVFLAAIVFKQKFAIYGVWIAILLLIASQFFLSFVAINNASPLILPGLEPLKGVIFPALITYFYFNKSPKVIMIKG